VEPPGEDASVRWAQTFVDVGATKRCQLFTFAGLYYTMLVAAAVTACLILAGCGGGSTRATTSAAPAGTVTSTTPAQGGAFLPAVNRVRAGVRHARPIAG
jgi:outer membrane murein-binding lipoprotein Lpp